MATLTFDTHAFVKELTQAGMPERTGRSAGAVSSDVD